MGKGTRDVTGQVYTKRSRGPLTQREDVTTSSSRNLLVSFVGERTVGAMSTFGAKDKVTIRR